MAADLSDAAVCEKVILSALEKFRPIDGNANIAGGTRAEEWMPLEDTPADRFRKTVQHNFGHVFYIARDAAQEWIRTGRPGSTVSVARSVPRMQPLGTAPMARRNYTPIG